MECFCQQLEASYHDWERWIIFPHSVILQCNTLLLISKKKYFFFQYDTLLFGFVEMNSFFSIVILYSFSERKKSLLQHRNAFIFVIISKNVLVPRKYNNISQTFGARFLKFSTLRFFCLFQFCYLRSKARAVINGIMIQLVGRTQESL